MSEKPLCLFCYSISSMLQPHFIEEGFQKTENFEHSGVLVLFLFPLPISVFDACFLGLVLL